jgi:hypothetical protein
LLLDAVGLLLQAKACRDRTLAGAITGRIGGQPGRHVVPQRMRVAGGACAGAGSVTRSCRHDIEPSALIVYRLWPGAAGVRLSG